MHRQSARSIALALGVLVAPLAAQAQLVNLGPGSFTPAASTITFSEPGYPTGTVNPTYSFTALPNLGDVTVSFAGAFVGQTVAGGSLVGAPTGPLALNTTYEAFITGDGAVPTSPVLSGTPVFNGPIAVLFSTPVAAVGLSGGFFDAIGGTSITAYGIDGALLGSIVNSKTGIEFYGLATASGAKVISGITFHISGSEPAGFGIDNLTFGARDVVILPGVPEPATVVLTATGLLGLGALARRRRG